MFRLERSKIIWRIIYVDETNLDRKCISNQLDKELKYKMYCKYILERKMYQNDITKIEMQNVFERSNTEIN